MVSPYNHTQPEQMQYCIWLALEVLFHFVQLDEAHFLKIIHPEICM